MPGTWRRRALPSSSSVCIGCSSSWRTTRGRSPGSAPFSAAEERYALTEALAGEVPGAEPSRLEIDRGGPSYSVDTAEAVLAATAGRPVELFLVIGADLVPELGSWHRHEDLQDLVTLAVVSRPGDTAPAAAPGWRVVRVDGPQVDLSSSQVRDLLASGGSVEGLVPDGVIRCIRRHGMYAVPR